MGKIKEKIRNNKVLNSKPVYIIRQIFYLLLGVIKEIYNFIRIPIRHIICCCIVCGIVALLYLKPTLEEYYAFAVHSVYNTWYEVYRQIPDPNCDDDEAVRHRSSSDRYLLYNDIPEDVVNAFIAVEDRSFWTHKGIDIKGLTRVAWRAIKTKGKELHGASTITQQLARNVFLTSEISIKRKAKEFLLAREIEGHYTKKEIIEFYCNDVCFANGIFGIQNAAQKYFKKDAKDLSLKQIAYLCAIPNSPEYYNPWKDQRKAIPRCEKILVDMLECGYITEDEYNRAMQEEIKVRK